jgi:ParB/RepB/Spo0J family partition protein
VSSTIIDFPLDRIVNGLNNRTRFNDAALKTLAANMAGVGLIQPIVLRRVWRVKNGSTTLPVIDVGQASWDNYFTNHNDPTACGQIVAGERRTRAARLAGWTHIRADLRNLTDDQAVSIVLTENLEREDVDPVDEGHGYVTYMAVYGWDERKMAEVGCVTVDRVRECIALTRLLPDLQTMLRSGALPRAHALHLAQLDYNRQASLAEVFTKGRLPAFETFKAMVAELSKQQAEEGQHVLDLGMLYQAKLIAAEATGMRVRLKRLPIAPWLPPLELKLRGKSRLANQLVDYANALPEQARDAVLAVVEALVDLGKLPANESEWT